MARTAPTMWSDFNLRSPHGERLSKYNVTENPMNISIYAPRTGSDQQECTDKAMHSTISIYAPRTGSDSLTSASRHEYRDFNLRSPHGERHNGTTLHHPHQRFQSTLPARGATFGVVRVTSPVSISIYAPRTGSDNHNSRSSYSCHISIYAPRTGSDGGHQLREYMETDFNLRSPHGERPFFFASSLGNIDFNLRSPHGERQGLVTVNGVQLVFQSTLPARGATWTSPVGAMESRYFNLRSPHGERLRHPPDLGGGGGFQSTLPARGATAADAGRDGHPHISIYAPRTGSDCAK